MITVYFAGGARAEGPGRRRQAPGRCACRAGVRRGLAILALLGMGIGWSWGAEESAGKSSPPPLSSADLRAVAETETNVLWLRTMAEDAVEAGFYTVAEDLYQRALDAAKGEEAVRHKLILGLVSALLAQSKTAEAAAWLEKIPAQDGPAWKLRRAGVAFQRGDFPAIDALLGSLDSASLDPSERGWFHFLRAMAFDHAGDHSRADAAFEQALRLTTASAQEAAFRLARVQTQLSVGEASEGLAAQLKREMEERQGQRIGYRYALQYATVLHALGRTAEAVSVLTRQRDVLPPDQPQLRDQTLLMLGLIGLAGADPAQGRQAFRDLLVQGSDPELQEAALIRLASSAPSQGGAGTMGLRQLYDQLLSRKPAHPLYEQLIFFSAELALRNGDLVRAESDVDRLLTLYPGTDLRRNALALLASSSWLSQRYRNAANYVAQIRAVANPEDRVALLAVLQAECYYRAGEQAGTAEDFRNSAEAYAAARRMLSGEAAPKEGPIGRGLLFFQQVMATIRSGDRGGALALLDDQTTIVGVDPQSRWQAEWNYVRAVRRQGDFQGALQRVQRLAQTDDMPAELQLRFLWLSAQLTLDGGLAAETASRVERVLTFLESPRGQSVAAGLRREVSSSVALLAAQARLETGDIRGGMAAMERLRQTDPNSRAALYSYIVQARYYANDNQLVEAQRLLTELADKHRGSEYAPMALYEAALQAERRGQDAYLIEATQLLERMANEYPAERFQFAARLRQADISRRLLRFDAAETLYLYLENTFPNHPDLPLAQLSLADTLLAQSANSPAKFGGAITRLERLAVLPGAGGDLRVEAGHKLAHAWQIHGSAERASMLYWEVYERFLRHPESPVQLGPRGRYWLARTLFEFGQLEENAGRRDNARRAYEAVLEYGLPGEKLARGRLAQFQNGG